MDECVFENALKTRILLLLFLNIIIDPLNLRLLLRNHRLLFNHASLSHLPTPPSFFFPISSYYYYEVICFWFECDNTKCFSCTPPPPPLNLLLFCLHICCWVFFVGVMYALRLKCWTQATYELKTNKKMSLHRFSVVIVSINMRQSISTSTETELVTNNSKLQDRLIIFSECHIWVASSAKKKLHCQSWRICRRYSIFH